MKKLFFILLLAVTAFSCAKEETDSTFKIDPLAKISIKPAAGTILRSLETDTTHLSALEIVKRASVLQIFNKFGSNQDSVIGERGFDVTQKDTISSIPKLYMNCYDIINEDGSYVSDFIEAKNILLIHYNPLKPYDASMRDTLAYIPNSVMRSAEAAIKIAYADKDTASCYQVFNEAFTFIPITGAEYKILKDLNQQ